MKKENNNEESTAKLTEKQKKLPPALQKAILKNMKKKGGGKDDKTKDEKEDKDKKDESKATSVEVKRVGEVLEVDIQKAAQKYFGGKTRTELKDSDFLFPQKRSFPIVTPQDVPDAVSNFGRMSGNMSYEEFKSKLVSFVKKKGAKFVAALPNTIKKEFDLADATQIAVFPDKKVDPEEVGTPVQDTRPINEEGFKIDEKLKNEVEKEKLKNPKLQSA